MTEKQEDLLERLTSALEIIALDKAATRYVWNEHSETDKTIAKIIAAKNTDYMLSLVTKQD